MGKIFSFHDKFKQGKQAEDYFSNHFKLDGQTLKPSGIRDYDFVTDDGVRVELKTDFHISDNFFIEYSFGKDAMSQKPGSIWQSCFKEVDVFIFWFLKMGEVFIFRNLPEVIIFTEKYITDNEILALEIQNIGFYGVGYKLPKTVFNHLFEKGTLQWIE